MKPGSVLVDLAVERGGNVEGAVAGAVITLDNGVKIVGHLNVPGRVAASASLLYAKNLYAFVETMVDKTTKAFAVNREDELVKATMLTDAGKVVHPAFADAAAAAEKTEAEQKSADEPAAGGEPAKAEKKPSTSRDRWNECRAPNTHPSVQTARRKSATRFAPRRSARPVRRLARTSRPAPNRSAITSSVPTSVTARCEAVVVACPIREGSVQGPITLKAAGRTP